MGNNNLYRLDDEVRQTPEQDGSENQPESQAGQVSNQALTVDDIVSEAVNQPTVEEQKRGQLRQMLRDTRIKTDTDVPPEKYALEVDGKGIFALRDIHAVKAKAKAGKTTVLKVCVAALLKGQVFRVKSLLNAPRILYFDTEQNQADAKKILEDVARMTGLIPSEIDRLVSLYALRRTEREFLLPMFELALQEEHPLVIFLDGIVELVQSFNDEVASKELIKELLKLCDVHGCAIVCVLHTNKADEDHNMRGHLGTMLAQKAGTVLECRKERGSSIITVTCSEARHQEMPDWSIAFDEEGCIVDADELRRQLLEQRKADQQQRRLEAYVKEKQERLEQCLRIVSENGGLISRKQLTERLVKALERERSTVASYISAWLKDGSLLMVNDMIQLSANQSLPFSPR